MDSVEIACRTRFAPLHIAATLCLAACVYSLIGPPVVAAPPRGQLHVVLIGGMNSDPTPAQIAGTAFKNEGNSGMFQLCGELRALRITAEYFNWNGSRAGELKSAKPPQSRGIAKAVRTHLRERPCDRVAIVGNSWGGHTALEVVQLLYDSESPLAIDLLVFLDGSSTGRVGALRRKLPPNVQQSTHYFTRNAFVWGKWDAGERLENIDLGDVKSGYMFESKPPYHAKFDFQAHVSAEWDPRVHADIHRRLSELVPE